MKPIRGDFINPCFLMCYSLNQDCEFMYTNPFTYGRPIEDPDLLYGRDLTLNQIVGRLRNVAFESTSIVGERRSGKTSLLKVLMHPKIRERFDLDDQYIF